MKSVKEVDGTETSTYTFTINFDRWKAIAAGLYLEFLAGIIYAFPVYSGQLKDLLGATQTELNFCSTMGTIGGNFSILAGIFLDRNGTRLTSHIGALISALGFLILYFVTVGTIPGGYVSAAIGFLVAYQGLTWMDMSVVTAQVTNFPRDKGLSVGLVKTQFGLASSAIVILAVGLFGGAGKISQTARCSVDGNILEQAKLTISDQKVSNNTHSILDDDSKEHPGLPLLYFFSYLCLAIGTFSSFFLRRTPPTSPNGGKLGPGGMTKMYVIYGCVVILMVYCLIVSLLNLAWRKVGEPPKGVNFVFALIEIALYAFPYLVTFRTKRARTLASAENNIQGHNEKSSIDSSLADEKNVDSTATASPSRSVPASAMNEYEYFEALQTLDFWCLFFTFFGGTGSAYMTINNLTQINYALGGNLVEKSYLVVLIGVFNCVGRIIMGNIQDVVGSACGITRPALCSIAIFFVGASQLILAFTDFISVGISMMAFGFGSTWCLIGPVTSDVVGRKAYGKIFSTVSMSAMLSTTIFNSVIAGPLYDYATKLQGGEGKTCCGHKCYFKAHVIAAAVSFVVMLAPTILYFRTRKFYKKMLFKEKHQDTSTLYVPLMGVSDDALNAGT